MNDEQNRIPLFNELLRGFGTIFSLSVLAIAFVVMVVSRYFDGVQHYSTLFVSGAIGLSFGTIFQIAGFSLVLAAFKTLLFSEKFSPNIRYLWRVFLLFPAALLTVSVFAIFFKWFPVNDLQAWLGFIASTSICFSISLGLTLLKFKLESKKYNQLLSDFKAGKKNDKPS